MQTVLDLLEQAPTYATSMCATSVIVIVLFAALALRLAYIRYTVSKT